MTIRVDLELIKPRLVEMQGTSRSGRLEIASDIQNRTEKYAVMTSLFSGVKKCSASDPSIGIDRAGKVADLKRRIHAGNYQPDLGKVAESLLNYIMAGK